MKSKEKIGKIHSIPFKYLAKDAVDKETCNVLGYFGSKKKSEKSEDYIVINSVTNSDKLYLEVKPKRGFLRKVAGYVNINSDNYAVYTKPLVWPFITIAVILVVMIAILVFTGSIHKNSFKLQDLQPGKPEAQKSVSKGFDINLFAVGDITKDNPNVPFTNSSNNDLLCVYTFYDEDHNELEKTDYLAPSDGEYYYFNAYKYFNNGPHTLYFTVETFHADTGKPDTAANLSMPINVVKEE